MDIKKYLLSSVVILAMSGTAWAQDNQQVIQESAVIESETVTTADLGTANPGLLPTNPFYFIKEWGRGAKRLFTFNPVKKAELELRVIKEKAAEVKKVEETRPQDTEAVVRALKNYQKSQERLKIRLEAIQETSQNPNVDRLFDDLAERTVKHEKVFDEIAKKFEAKTDVQSLVGEIKGKIEESAAAASVKDDPVKFAAKLEKALIESKGGELKHVRSLEIIDRLSRKASAGTREALENLRQDFSGKLEGDIKDLLNKEEADTVQQAISGLPGDASRRAVIIDEIRGKAGQRVSQVLEKVSETLKKTAQDEKHIDLKAKEQISDAEERVQKLEKRFGEIIEAPAAAKKFLTEAQNNLKEARSFFEQGKYGEAFGKARVSEVSARNGLKILEELDEADEQPDIDELKRTIEELDIKISKYEELLKAHGFTRDSRPEAYVFLDNARKHLGFARDAFSKSDFAGTKLHIRHVKEFLQSLSRVIEGKVRSDFKSAGIREVPIQKAEPVPVVKPPVEAKPVACTQEYAPVCGADGKTYSNKCMARAAGVEIKHMDECQTGREDCGPMPSLPAPPSGCGYDGPRCLEKEWKYKLVCKEQNDLMPSIEPLRKPSEKPSEPLPPQSPASGANGAQPPSATAGTDNRSELKEVTVVIGEDGRFSPSSVKVKKGGKVTWINKSAKSVWPASAVHPSHRIYPEFDALRGIKEGGTYSFVFEKIGNWKYHNHLNPSATGVVEVIE